MQRRRPELAGGHDAGVAVDGDRLAIRELGGGALDPIEGTERTGLGAVAASARATPVHAGGAPAARFPGRVAQLLERRTC